MSSNTASTRPSVVNSKSQTTSSWRNNTIRGSNESDGGVDKVKSSKPYPLANAWTFYHDK